MKTEIMIAIVGVAGILLGAGAQHFFTQRGESAKHFQDLRTQSYVDFIKATAGIAIAQKNQQPEKEFESTALMTEAKARIAIYGSPSVASATADFFRRYGALTSPDAFKSFVSIVSSMRADTPGGETRIPNLDIGQLILGVDVE